MEFPKPPPRKKKNPKYQRALAKAAVRRRSGGRCEAPVHAKGCNGRGEHVHHRRLLAQGGTDHPGNMYDLSLMCHTYWHLHPEEAELHGIIIDTAAARRGVFDQEAAS